MKMNKYTFKYTLTLLFCMGLGLASCSDRDKEITSVDLDRVLTPYNIQYGLSNVVDLTLTWQGIEGVDGYIVELYKDSLLFLEENFYDSGEVDSNKFQYTLDGNTQYSARVKSISTTKGDSKWNGIAFKTSFKSVFLPFEKGDVTVNSIRLRFPQKTQATNIKLASGSGAVVEREVTAQELAEGIIDFEDLQSNVLYKATLYNGEIKIGETSATTIMDGATIVRPSDNLKELLEAAEEGDAFLLEQGEYLEGEVVTLSKSVTIMGTIGGEPIIHGQFEVENEEGVTRPSISFKHVILDGLDQSVEYAVRLVSDKGNYGSVSFEACDIKDYKKSFIGADKITGEVTTVSIENCVVSNILSEGAEAIDIRKGYVGSLLINNSTFNNVAPTRSFIRLDDSSSSFPGKTSLVKITNCTLHKVADSLKGKGLLYVRFQENSLVFENNLVTDSEGIFSKESKTSQPACGSNNYFNAPNFMEGGAEEKAKVDNGNPTTADPEYVDAESGNFKVENGMVQVGDPRWLN